MNVSRNTVIYIVRHGESEQNARYEKDKTFVHELWGELESPLTDKGRYQSKQTAKHLQKVHFDAAYSSNLIRAVETAEIIVRGRNMTVSQIPHIHEIKLGKKFFALSPDEREQIKAVAKRMPNDKMMKFRYTEDGETPHEGIMRLRSFLSEVAKIHVGQTILIANHGNLMRKFLMHLDWATFEELPDGGIENAGYFVIETNGKSYTVKKTYKINKISQD